MANHQSPIINHETGATAPVITLDGPSGSGKGTLSRALALGLGWHLLDSGALYRLVALAVDRAGLDPADETNIEAAERVARGLDAEFQVIGDGAGERVLLAGEDVTRAIRSETVGNQASFVAARPAVRQALLSRQREFRRPPGLVADGRDMGTVVFPDAELKLYITASAEERARRRCEQLSQAGANANIDQIYREILARDERDQARQHSPLRPASDARVIDTTALDVGETLARIRGMIRESGLA